MKNLSFLLFFMLFGFPSLHYACNQLDRESLLSFSSNISSFAPLNWSSSIDCCLWEGIVCDTNGYVVNLSLPSRGLTGAFAPYIWNLTQLHHLDLSHNRLWGAVDTGVIPLKTLDLSYNRLSGKFPSFHPLKSIERVDLSSNMFGGQIPPSFFQLAEYLKSFNISRNSFTGPIPSAICFNSSPSIKILDFSINNFIGQIPNGFWKCSQLEVFRAGFNRLFGSIPKDIYRAVSLREISLPFSYLSGTISTGIGNLTNLKILELDGNEFTGFIPQDIGKLSNLEYLFLHINNLTGSLPSSLSNCTNLVALNLRVNSLGGEVAKFNFSGLLRLKALDLGNNYFTGIIPVGLYSCRSLTAVRLASNQLEGQIPSDILALGSLSFLSLSRNKLTNIASAINILMDCKNLTTLILSRNFMNEAIPNDGNTKQSNGFQNLQVLALEGCQLGGQIPTWLASLKSLQAVDLSFNRLTGPIPGWLGNLPHLFYLDLSNNLISGNLPQQIGDLSALASTQTLNQLERSYLEFPLFFVTTTSSNLQYNQLSSLPAAIYLGGNSLGGEIPTEIGHLKYLQELNLSYNDFHGKIPEQLSNLTNLERLDLSGNHLSGELPSLKSLHFLSSFGVADNNLQGPIPSGGQFDTFPSSSFLGNAGLCGPILQRSCAILIQPETPPLDTPEESSHNTLVMGLIAGFIFGLIVGSAYGSLFPVNRLKKLLSIRPINRTSHASRRVRAFIYKVPCTQSKERDQEKSLRLQIKP